MGNQVWINTRNSWSYYFCFLGLGGKEVGGQELDETEEIEVELIPIKKWIEMAETEIEDPCAVVTTVRALPYIRQRR